MDIIYPKGEEYFFYPFQTQVWRPEMRQGCPYTTPSTSSMVAEKCEYSCCLSENTNMPTGFLYYCRKCPPRLSPRRVLVSLLTAAQQLEPDSLLSHSFSYVSPDQNTPSIYSKVSIPRHKAEISYIQPYTAQEASARASCSSGRLI